MPAKFLVRCMWPDVRASEATRCCYCKLRESGGVDQIVEIALPPEELIAAVGNERAFLEVQARRSVRSFRDCSLVKPTTARVSFFRRGSSHSSLIALEQTASSSKSYRPPVCRWQNESTLSVASSKLDQKAFVSFTRTARSSRHLSRRARRAACSRGQKCNGSWSSRILLMQ